MRRALLSIAILCVLAAEFPAHEQPDLPTTADLIDAVANTAAIFSRTAPGLVAQEVLHQRGRRGLINILQQGQKEATVKLPQDFRTHEAVSDYALAQIGDSRAIHEIRSLITIDGRTVKAADEARHALAIGVKSPDDELKHRLLENFERNRLEGAVTDFGQLILLFGASARSRYTFTMGHQRLLNGVPMTALEYKQVSGSTGLTVFHERVMDVRSAQGEIWLRNEDLLPLRITMFTESPLPGGLVIRDNAVVDYTPTTVGLAPAHIHHMQFLSADLLVENDLQYSGYQRLTPGILP